MASQTIRREPPRVLVVGYNGANNTGAEALLLADVADLRAVLGPDVRLTVPSLSIANLRRYLPESTTVRIVRMPTLFFAKVWRLVARHDLVVLVEGSTFMDSWGSALLSYFLWTARCAQLLGKPCLAYAVDAGELCPRNRRRTGRVASGMDLIVTRAAASGERLRACGVATRIEVTADNAFTFEPDPADANLLEKAWPEARGGVVGLAAVDFYLFPGVFAPFARKKDLYKWPYAFSRSRERTRAAAALAQEYADFADWLVTERKRSVALICMEELDGALAEDVRRRMRYGDLARVFSSREYTASQMTSLLRGLDLLVTSRYHAAVLSLARQVPQVAVGHDLRLRSLYDELGLQSLFVDPLTPMLSETLKGHAARLLGNPAPARDLLRRGYDEHVARARRNRDHLRDFVERFGWGR